MGGKRAKAIPDVPTMKELGYNIEYYLWVGIFAPKGTPDSAITFLRRASARRRTAISTRPQSPIWAGPRVSGCTGIRKILGQRCQAVDRGGGHDRSRQVMIGNGSINRVCARDRAHRRQFTGTNRNGRIDGSTQFRRRLDGRRRRTGCRSGTGATGLPVEGDHADQSIPAGRSRRRGRPAAGGGARADLQTAGGDGDQGRRRRTGRRPVRRQRQAGRLHALVHIVSISGFAEVDKLFGRSRSSPAPISFRSRASSPTRCCWWSTTSSPTRPSRTWSTTPRSVPRHRVQLVRALWRAASADRAVHEGGRHPEMRHLPTNGGGPALTAILGNNSQMSPGVVDAAADQGRQAAGAGVVWRRAVEYCRMCRR